MRPEDSTVSDSEEQSSEGERPALRERVDRRRVLHALGVVLFVALLAPFVVHAVPELAGGDDSYVVLSGSMEPAIGTGDSVVVRSVDPETVEVGDVVTVRTGDGAPTTHRVVERLDTGEGPQFRTKGDANAEPDGEPVAASRILGTVVLTIPLVGYVLEALGTPFGFAAFVGVPVATLTVWELATIVRTQRDDASGGDPTFVDGTVGTVDDGDDEGDALPPPSGAAADSDGGSARTGASEIVLTRLDLTATLVTLAVLTAYSATVAYLHRSFWSVSVGVAAAGTFLFLLALWYVAPDGEPARRPVATDGGGSE
jgi:signal peptidase